MSSIPLKYRLARLIGHQHYLRRGRDRIIRLFADPERAPSIAFKTDFFGCVYSGNLSDFLDWSVYVYGAYSNHELQLLGDVARALRIATEHITFCDIGANVGQHTLFMSKWADEVISFEPFEPVRQKLLNKLEENKIKNVKVFQVALGERDEDLLFSPPTSANSGVGSFRRTGTAPTLSLPVREGNTFFAANELPRIDIMKIDVEGFESAVFRGLRERIRRDRPVILFEVSGADRSGFFDINGFTDVIYDEFELFAVGCTSISGTYRIKPPSFASDDEFLIVPRERAGLLKGILSQSYPVK